MKINLQENTDFIDSTVYAVSTMQARIHSEYIDSFFALHVKAKPKYIPKFLYKWILKKLLIMVHFKK